MPAPDETDNLTRQSEAAEATHFRARSAADSGLGHDTSQSRRASDGGYMNAAKSIRLHARASRGGLAARLAAPILLAMLLGLLLISFIIHVRVGRLQIKDLRNSCANSAFSASVLGRLLITHREKFLQGNPEYLHKAEWKAGEHWLITHGFVSQQDWVEATGFQLDEYAPASIMEKAGEKTILADFSRYLNSPRADSEIVALYILNANNTPLASAQKQSFRFDPLALQAVLPPSNYTEVGGARITVDYIADLEPEPMVRGIARIMDPNQEDNVIGSALVVLRTQRNHGELNSFLLLLLSLAVLLTILMSLVSWYAAKRVTAPIRRLAEDMQAMAEGDFTRRAAVRENDELGLLAQAFNSMAERLRIARLNEKETNRLESDLSIARDIQNNLLPPQTPRVRGFDIHTSYRPAKEIGGDYFDFLPVDDQHMGIVVADASGKSIPAALVMSTTRAILRFVAPGSESAAETLTQVNAILSVDIPKGMFVTAYYLILDPLESSMLCASAGHTPLLIARTDGSVELLNPGGIALGFDNGPIFQRSIREQRVRLEKGDRILLYTDGVVECVNTSDEEYSDRRLREFTRRNRELNSHDFVGALMADLDRHRGAAEMRDDTTIVTIKVL